MSEKSAEEWKAFLSAVLLVLIILALAWVFSPEAEAADLACDYQPVIFTEQNPWEITKEQIEPALNCPPFPYQLPPDCPPRPPQ